MNTLPLAQLSAFEAAARCLSFTQAAAQANVLQPAISRQVAALEAQLGVQLFQRTKPRLTLTTEGAALYRAVSDGFDAIRAEMRRLTVAGRDAPIVVNAAIGFTSLYLMPRLAGFQALYPDIPVQIVTRDQNTGFQIENADIVVSFGATGLKDCASEVILKEVLVPICAPGLTQIAHPMPLEWILTQKLLHMSSPDHADDWALYLDGTGLVAPPPEPTERIMSYMVYLTSIQNGAGIGLGWRGLIDRDLRDGRLFQVSASSVATHRAYWANLTPRAARNAGAKAFYAWCADLGNQELGAMSAADG